VTLSIDAPRAGAEVELEITDLARGGRGVGRASRLVVFVEGGLPGERLRARIRSVRRGFAEAELLSVLEPSPDRVVPPCPHYADCGGCDRQHLAPQAQAARRVDQVREALQRIGGFAEPPVLPTEIPSEPWAYRFRMDFDWCPGPRGPRLGLHHRHRPGQVVAINRCLLAGEQTNALLEWLPQAASRLGLTAFEPMRRRGLLRRVSVQEARGTRELLVTLLTGRGQPQPLERLAAEMTRRFPRLVGVVRSELSRDDSPQGATILAGRDYLHEVLEGDQYRIPCEAFFQPNPLGSLAVRRHALAALALRAGGSLLELYSGVGFFTLGAARAAVRTTAVEASAPACAAARVNLAAAGAGEVRIIRSGVSEALPGLLREAWDAVLLDPPRIGLEASSARALAGAAAPRMVYVSCDPATLARDLRILTHGGGYLLAAVTPFEIFAQTQHVECVAVLKRG
jgi:23S rRNA (uracil1939-C5)-methyltransferase